MSVVDVVYNKGATWMTVEHVLIRKRCVFQSTPKRGLIIIANIPRSCITLHACPFKGAIVTMLVLFAQPSDLKRSWGGGDRRAERGEAVCSVRKTKK